MRPEYFSPSVVFPFLSFSLHYFIISPRHRLRTGDCVLITASFGNRDKLIRNLILLSAKPRIRKRSSSRLISSISLSRTPQQQKPCRSLARAKTGAGMCKWWNYSGSVSCRGVKEISRLFYTFWHLLLLKLKLEIGMLVGKIKNCGGGFLRIIDKRLIENIHYLSIYLNACL